METLHSFLQQPDVFLAFVILAGVAALTIIFRIYAKVRRTFTAGPRQLKAWARSVTFSNRQLTAMRSLWQWYRTGRVPAADPLKHLSPAEVADLVSRCSLQYMPIELQKPDEDQLRTALVKALEEQGMESLHAEIVSGMKYGRLGPANDL